MPLDSWKVLQAGGPVRVLVLGSGVMGLTTALELLERGYAVTVLSKEFPLPHGPTRFASEATGAIYCPPECIKGREGNVNIVPKLKVWSQVTGRKLFTLCGNPNTTGVYMRELVCVLKQKASADDLTMLRSLPGFYHSPSLLEEKGICTKTYKDAYSYFTPSLNPRPFMMWLYDECKRKGAQFIQEMLHGPIKDQVNTLRNRLRVQFIVNCTGLGAAELAEDKNVYPIRGALVLVKNDGSSFPKINHCLDVPEYTSFGVDDRGQKSTGHLIFILRGDEDIALGSFYQPDRWDTDIPISYPVVRGMLKKLSALYPPLEALKDTDMEVIVGFRPGRRGDVRLELDPSLPRLIHNYGHGRYGMSLSFGCAMEVADMIDKIVGPSFTAKL